MKETYTLSKMVDGGEVVVELRVDYYLGAVTLYTWATYTDVTDQFTTTRFEARAEWTRLVADGYRWVANEQVAA